MAEADRLFTCRCGVPTDNTGTTIAWDSVVKKWRLFIWQPGPASGQVNSLDPVAGCPLCLLRCNFNDTLPASSIPVIVQETLRKLNADNEVVALSGPLGGADLPEPEEC